MRDRRDNREYRDRRHHVDRNSDDTRRHKPPPRLVRLSGSPPVQAPPHRSSYRRDLIPRQSDHHNPMHQDYPSPHHPRTMRHHSPTVRDYHHDLYVPGYMHPDYPTDLSHGIKHQTHGLDPHPHPHPHPLAGPSRSYPETLKQDSILDDMLPGGIRDIDLHHRHTRDLYGGDRVRDRDRDRGRDRDTGKGLYQREVPHPVAVTTTHLGPLDGGQSSYGHGRLCYEHSLPAPEDISRAALGRSPDDLRKSRDRVSDHYNNLALDDMYGKMPYTGHDYFRVDGTAYSPKTAREGRVYSDLPHHSTHKDVGPIYHGFEQGPMARPLYRHDAPLPFEDRHKFQREVACVAEREIPQSPIFPDCAKRLHHTLYSPSHNGYANDLGYEPSLERLMAREHQLRHVHDHDHVHNNVIYDDSIFEDDDDDVGNDNNGDEDGHVSNPRITVKDRLNLPSPLLNEVDHPIIRRAGPSRNPVVIHGKHHHSQKMAVPAAMRTNSVKKRLQSGPLDLRRENFRAHKLQRRGMDDEPNIRKVNYEYEMCPDEDAANTVLRDPPEGSEELNKQVEKAFFKYAKIVNESSREKKKFLPPGKGSVVCYVCGRFVFFFLH